jgi:hypothetical protein
MEKLNDGHAGRAYVLAVVAGMGLWFWIALMSGRREAWDSSAFWAIGYPVAIAVSALLGYFFPTRPWRWALALFFAQFLAMMIRNGEVGSLWPLGMMLFAVLAVPGMITAKIAATIRAPGKNAQS